MELLNKDSFVISNEVEKSRENSLRSLDFARDDNIDAIVIQQYQKALETQSKHKPIHTTGRDHQSFLKRGNKNPQTLYL